VNPSGLLGRGDPFFKLHGGPVSNVDLKGRHLKRPIWVEGINTTGCCLVPQGDLSRHPSAMQPSARCLTSCLKWFGPVENKTLTSLQDLKCTFGGEGYSRWPVGVQHQLTMRLLPGITTWKDCPWGATLAIIIPNSRLLYGLQKKYCTSRRHSHVTVSSPYCAFILWRLSAGFTFSFIMNLM
jgi:hypothetical protein